MTRLPDSPPPSPANTETPPPSSPENTTSPPEPGPAPAATDAVARVETSSSPASSSSSSSGSYYTTSSGRIVREPIFSYPLGPKVTVKIYKATDQGHREYMEDFIGIAGKSQSKIVETFPKSILVPEEYRDSPDADQNYLYMGVFDGHGGKEPAVYCRNRLFSALFESSSSLKQPPDIRNAFLLTHDKMLDARAGWNCSPDKLNDRGYSTAGTCASIMLINQKTGMAFTGHVGDAKIIVIPPERLESQQRPLPALHQDLGSATATGPRRRLLLPGPDDDQDGHDVREEDRPLALAIAAAEPASGNSSAAAEQLHSMEWAEMTQSHRPSENDQEIRRVIKDGGRCIRDKTYGELRVAWRYEIMGRPRGAPAANTDDRVQGSSSSGTRSAISMAPIYHPFLSVTRSLGDYWSYNPDTDTYVVSPEPQLNRRMIADTQNGCIYTEFVIIASDGLWDIISPHEAVEALKRWKSMREKKKRHPKKPRTVLPDPAQYLLETAIQRHSFYAFRSDNRDNASVVIALIEPSDRVYPEKPASSSTVQETEAAESPVEIPSPVAEQQ